MQVAVRANRCDEATSPVASVLWPVFQELGRRLSGEYGGTIEHLWLDLELVERGAKVDGTPRYPFRYQRRVSGRSQFGLPPLPDCFNVGHFSVRPDFALISSLPADQAIRYALQLIFRATEVLKSKKKQLGGFDAERFRTSFRKACSEMGYGDVA